VALAAGAVLLAASPAGASGDTVSAVFSVTGVSTSNCTVSTGGADVYIKPGDTLNVKSSLVGVTALGAAVNIAKVASIDGDLTIDPGTNHAQVLPISGTARNINGLTAGNHVFTWRADQVTLLGIKVPLKLDTKLAAAGASLNYQGTIHVTTSAPKCGIAVQVPGPSVSVSVTGLPPIKVSLPPVNVNVPVDPGQVIKPPTKTTTPPPGSGSSGGGLHYTPPPPTVPDEVVPKGSGGFLGGGGGYFGGALPDVSSIDVGPSVLAPAKTVPNVKVVKAGPSDVKKAKNPELAANKAPSAQMPVVLAIIAIIALAMVTATYARLYLLRRQ
jgi:hypothetical protein